MKRTLGLLDEAAADSADFVAFPGMMTFIGPEKRFVEVAETLDDPTIQWFSEKAREHGVFVHTGSFFEWVPDSDRVYDTSMLIGPSDGMLDTHRKVHLFDIELDGGVERHGSDYAAPGDRPMTVNTDLAAFGLSVCCDLRFPGLYRVMAQPSADILLVPSTFTIHIGKDHQEPLLRARAIENQAYVIAPGQIGDKPSWVETYGRTPIVDPWGNMIPKTRDREEVVATTIGLSHLDEIRHGMQTLQHAQPDVYERSKKWGQDADDSARLASTEGVPEQRERKQGEERSV